MNEHIAKRIKVVAEAMLAEYKEKHDNLQSGNRHDSERSGQNT